MAGTGPAGGRSSTAWPAGRRRPSGFAWAAPGSAPCDGQWGRERGTWCGFQESLGQRMRGGAHGAGQLVELGRLVEEARGTGAQVPLAVGRAGVVAEDDEGDAGRGAAHGAQDLEALA